MPKILCITSNFPRWQGDSTTPFVLHLARDLIKLGWRIDVLAPHTSGAKRYEVLDDVTVFRFPYLLPYESQTICYGGGALINLRQNKLNYLKLPFLVGSQLLNLFNLLYKNRYHIIHSHWILPQGFSGVIASKIFNIPHVLTVHGGDIFGLQKKPLVQIKEMVIRNSDFVTVNSTFTQKAVLNLVPNRKNLFRIPMGVSTNTRISSERINRIRNKFKNDNGPLLVFVGRIVEEKGVGDLLAAIKILSPIYPSISAIIVGEGQDRSKMERIAQSLAISSHVFFVGWITPDDVFDYISAGDIFVGPSRQGEDGWVEGQGLSFLEAMMAKTAVIATRSGGIVDTVRNEETGLLVNERAPDEIARAIIQLTENIELREKLIANGYKMVLTEYTRDYSASQFSQLFYDLINKNHQ